MSDEGDFWRDVKLARKEESIRRRRSNRENSAALLTEKGVKFESKNDGAHLIVSGNECLIDFWPGTGKFIARNGKKGRGVRNVLKMCTLEQQL